MSAIADATPAGRGLRDGATSAGSTAKPSSVLPTTSRTPTATPSSTSRRPSGLREPGGRMNSGSHPGSMPPSRGPYTVARAMGDYLEDYRRRGGKASDSIESVTGRNILPELGNVSVAKLTTRRLLDWHRAIAERPRSWRSSPGAAANVATFDRKDAEAVRRRRATANRVLTYLKAALNHAWRAGLVPSDDAWRRVKPFRSVDAPVIRYLSHAMPEACGRLWSTARPYSCGAKRARIGRSQPWSHA
jgi:hypothetical protein